MDKLIDPSKCPICGKPNQCAKEIAHINSMEKLMNTRFKIFVFLTLIFFLKLSNAAPEFSTSPGLKFLVGPSANFSASDKWVYISTHRDGNNKLMIYAHGGAGLTDSDKLRVSLFEKLGFDTISFDAFAMNELDGVWVNRNLTDRAKQDLIMNVMNGAIDFGMSQVSYTDIVFYGQSNGAKVVINSIQRYDPNPRIKLILSEAPPPSGYPLLLDVQTPTVLFFGELDNWGGKSENDFMWTRKFPYQPISNSEWVKIQSDKGRPVKVIFYPNAGHGFHWGRLTPITRTMAGIGAITGNLGANSEARIQYEKDINRLVGEVIKLN